jgi:hypothetical protein
MSFTILVVSKRAFLSSNANLHPVEVLFAATDKNIIRAEQDCERFREHQKGGEKWDFVIAVYPESAHQGSIIQGWRTAPNGVPENIAKSVEAHRLLSKRNLSKLIGQRER